MTVCAYLVFPETGAGTALAGQLAALPGCDVVPAENRDVLLLVTESSGPDEEAALRARVEELDGVAALVLTFGEIDPGSPEKGLEAEGRVNNRRLPVLGP